MGRDVVVSEDVGELVPGRPPAARSIAPPPRACALALCAATGHRPRRGPERARRGTRPRPPAREHDRGARTGARRARSWRHRRRCASSESATPPPQKDSPKTAASQSRPLCSGGRVSRRAASTAWTMSGRGSPHPSSRRSPPGCARQAAVEQKTHVLLGVERVAADPLDDRGRTRGSESLIQERRDQACRRPWERGDSVKAGTVPWPEPARMDGVAAARGGSSPEREAAPARSCDDTCSTKASIASPAQCRSSRPGRPDRGRDRCWRKMVQAAKVSS